MAKKGKSEGDSSAEVKAKKVKAAHKIGKIGAIILGAVSRAASMAVKNNYEDIEGMTPRYITKGEKVTAGVVNSASEHKNEGNRIKNKLTFDEKTGEAKGSIAKLLAGSEDNADFVEFRRLAKAAGPDFNSSTYSSDVRALAAKAVAFGGLGGGSRSGRTMSTDDLDLL
jgi:hypothetical protein